MLPLRAARTANETDSIPSRQSSAWQVTPAEAHLRRLRVRLDQSLKSRKPIAPRKLAKSTPAALACPPDATPAEIMRENDVVDSLANQPSMSPHVAVPFGLSRRGSSRWYGLPFSHHRGD